MDSITIENESKQSRFIALLKQYKILFNKSQLPKIKEAKEKSLIEVCDLYMKTFGKELNVKQLKKKIQNMKNEVKKKSDINATGNKKSTW